MRSVAEDEENTDAKRDSGDGRGPDSRDRTAPGGSPQVAPGGRRPGRIAWFDITTSNLPRAKEFYGNLFDWKFTPVIGNQAGGRVFLFLSTDDFWRDYHRMTAAGVRFVRPPSVAPYGAVAVFEDLYGNRWDLIEYGARAQASPDGSRGGCPLTGSPMA
ncbi:MAG TPA: VOC family protein [Thermoanaerobaculia bacterium]